jgi:carbamoyltransferase
MQAGRHCLGVHIGHDRGASIVSNGELVASMAEDRLDRRKHSNSPEMPRLAIAASLKAAGIGASDLAAAGISYTNVSIGSIIGQLADELRDVIERPSLDVHGVDHHDCHAWSAYFTSGESRSLILVADGAGDLVEGGLEAESLYVGQGNRIELVERRVQQPGSTRIDRRNGHSLAYMAEADRALQISLGRKYEQFTYLAGFAHGQAGKTMGLAAYARPLFRLPLPVANGIQFDLSFERGLTEIDQLWRASGEAWHRFVSRNRASIAAAAQQLLEDHMLALADSINPDGRDAALCAAGGTFLNCKMNHALLSGSKFERLHVFPAAGDDGQSVGAALYTYDECFGLSVRRLEHVYFGLAHDRAEILDRLRHFGLTAKLLDDAWLAERVAHDLAAGRIVALLRGRSEIGPRALCHRSILADPRREGMKDCLNFVKGRELFRPFAPVVAAENQFDYFELDGESRFMLLATRLREPYRAELPAIIHADETSRVQAISPEQDGFVHALLKGFEALTGYPILLNTSFNLAGDPIVESPHDAIVAFLAADIDVLVMENYYIDCKAIRSSVR